MCGLLDGGGESLEAVCEGDQLPGLVDQAILSGIRVGRNEIQIHTMNQPLTVAFRNDDCGYLVKKVPDRDHPADEIFARVKLFPLGQWNGEVDRELSAPGSAQPDKVGPTPVIRPDIVGDTPGIGSSGAGELELHFEAVHRD
jgi:hypothetical protein